jgi:hypothetical protein
LVQPILGKEEEEEGDEADLQEFPDIDELGD